MPRCANPCKFAQIRVNPRKSAQIRTNPRHSRFFAYSWHRNCIFPALSVGNHWRYKVSIRSLLKIMIYKIRTFIFESALNAAGISPFLRVYDVFGYLLGNFKYPINYKACYREPRDNICLPLHGPKLSGILGSGICFDSGSL